MNEEMIKIPLRQLIKWREQIAELIRQRDEALSELKRLRPLEDEMRRRAARAEED